MRRELGMEYIHFAMKPAPFAIWRGLRKLGATADNPLDRDQPTLMSGPAPWPVSGRSSSGPDTCRYVVHAYFQDLRADPARPSVRGGRSAMTQRLEKRGCDHIFFIGFLGAGKSTLARNFRERCSMVEFVDTDRLVERQEGSSVTKIFQERGEERFECWRPASWSRSRGERSLLVGCGGGIIENSAQHRADAPDGLLRLPRWRYRRLPPPDSTERYPP